MARLADHLVLLEAGRVLASGPIGELLTRLDLPMAVAEDGGALIDGVVSGYDPAYQLLRVQFPQCAERAGGPRAACGGSADPLQGTGTDVSLALQPPLPSSILNVLPVTVVEVLAAEHGAHVLVRLDMQGSVLLARITRYSHDQLGLQRGQQLWAQIKSVALLA